MNQYGSTLGMKVATMGAYLPQLEPCATHTKKNQEMSGHMAAMQKSPDRRRLPWENILRGDTHTIGLFFSRFMYKPFSMATTTSSVHTG